MDYLTCQYSIDNVAPHELLWNDYLWIFNTHGQRITCEYSIEDAMMTCATWTVVKKANSISKSRTPRRSVADPSALKSIQSSLWIILCTLQHCLLSCNVGQWSSLQIFSYDLDHFQVAPIHVATLHCTFQESHSPCVGKDSKLGHSTLSAV